MLDGKTPADRNSLIVRLENSTLLIGMDPSADFAFLRAGRTWSHPERGSNATVASYVSIPAWRWMPWSQTIFMDLAIERIDIAVRIGEPSSDPNLIVKKLADNPRIVVVSHDYLAHAGMPQHSDELAAHECVRIAYGGTYRARQIWTLLTRRSGRKGKCMGAPYF